MSTVSKFSKGYQIQCVYPNDCGGGGCGGDCGPGLGATDLGALGVPLHARFFSDELISTCDPRCQEINFDFGVGYNWLVSAWPYVLDRCGGPWFVVLPPGKVLRFCAGDARYAVYAPGGCGDCSENPGGGGLSGNQLRYQLYYEQDDFVLKDNTGPTWTFTGFCCTPPGRFKRYEDRNAKAQDPQSEYEAALLYLGKEVLQRDR